MNYFSKIINKTKYKFKKTIFSNYDKSKDIHYSMVPNLRACGFHKENSFYKKNMNAKKIIEFFDNFKNSEDFLFELNQENKSDRYKYRSHLTKYFDKEMLSNYAEDDFFLSNIKQYFGTKPYVRIIDVWLDKPVDKKFQKYSQNYHRDSDDYFLLKTFLCLNEITEENGPFQFIEKSHLDPWKNMSNNHENHQVENILYPDSKKISLIGKKGDLYVADTNGFHKGKSLINNVRCLLTVHYVSKFPKNKFLEDKFIY